MLKILSPSQGYQEPIAPPSGLSGLAIVSVAVFCSGVIFAWGMWSFFAWAIS